MSLFLIIVPNANKNINVILFSGYIGEVNSEVVILLMNKRPF